MLGLDAARADLTPSTLDDVRRTAQDQGELDRGRQAKLAAMFDAELRAIATTRRTWGLRTESQAAPVVVEGGSTRCPIPPPIVPQLGRLPAMDANATAASHLRIRVNVRIISPLRVNTTRREQFSRRRHSGLGEEVMSAMACRDERDRAASICIFRAHTASEGVRSTGCLVPRPEH